ncbi:MAG: L-rhamnose isomerase [Candidatus Hinthialibacter antarcticus]|nr:L-rhamnose isomerase [Candidatus Hinthialibacter antarcticus]
MTAFPERLQQLIEASGLGLDIISDKLQSQAIETPSWGYADSGTRFGVFKQPAAAKTLEHKLQDAAAVHQYTGIAPSVALHIPWDIVDNWNDLSKQAAALGIRIGAINSNTFQDQEYKLGSITHEDASVRRKAVDHMLDCVSIMRDTGSDILSLWFADGTNYPGQGSFRRRKQWMIESLQEVYNAMDSNMRCLVEYKLFEPGFYHTDLSDWGVSHLVCQHLGERAQVLVDLGHHAHGVNIEHIVALLISEGKLGGFHFNNRKCADDDLTVGSINPYELFLIYNELVDAELDPTINTNVAYMIDQSHNLKPKVEAMIQSVVNCQKAYAKALLVDRAALRRAQQEGDIVTAEQLLTDAYEADVEPLLQNVRCKMNVDPNPIPAFRQSGYQKKAEQERAKLTAAATLG